MCIISLSWKLKLSDGLQPLEKNDRISVWSKLTKYLILISYFHCIVHYLPKVVRNSCKKYLLIQALITEPPKCLISKRTTKTTRRLERNTHDNGIEQFLVSKLAVPCQLPSWNGYRSHGYIQGQAWAFKISW